MGSNKRNLNEELELAKELIKRGKESIAKGENILIRLCRESNEKGRKPARPKGLPVEDYIKLAANLRG
ncbi:hypothetical protein [Tenacibaculum maritimum]|uniref:hypothetical protein n=1 Tax=Tenacibaculum maritimum TaxID=107401 RepID=UPI0012E665B6|nr:hypothetical protein [Tenacibaculum maritimum]CAA0144288.1 hypothetical protein TM902_140057 [Tenacibaculum maritimum]CAA0193681.1 hypothetical protein TFA04_210059 [Tenacibaculum maritimum]CAA0196309.1 hypothetical protein JIP32914_220028 [Tenacibaculum maritimum]